MSTDDLADWNITCVAAHPYEKAVFALAVLYDGEDYYSYVYRLDDFESLDVPGANIYEASAYFIDMWVSPTGKIYVVDGEGLLHTNRLGTWETVDLKSPDGFNWIWGFSDDEIFACGDHGALVRFANNRWTHFGDGVDGHLYGLHGTAPDDLYAVGEEGRIFHFDGAVWLRAHAPTNRILNSVWCVSPKQIFVAGEGGMIFEGDGTAWTRLGNMEVDFYAVAEFQGAIYAGAGSDGVVIYRAGDLDVLNDEVVAYGLGASDAYLCASGDNQIARFDGSTWPTRSFS